MVGSRSHSHRLLSNASQFNYKVSLSNLNLAGFSFSLNLLREKESLDLVALKFAFSVGPVLLYF